MVSARTSSQEAHDTRALELYRSHARAVRVRCRRLLRDEQAAEDATQDTFVRVLRHLVAVPADDDVRRWLYRIATNVCLNKIRSERMAARFSSRAGPEALTPPSATEEDMANRDLIRSVLLRLPERARIISVRCHVDGMNHEELAREFGLSRRTVTYDLARFRDGARCVLASSTPR